MISPLRSPVKIDTLRCLIQGAQEQEQTFCVCVCLCVLLLASDVQKTDEKRK